VLAELVSMIAPEHDRGVLRQLQTVERIQQLAYLRVQECDGSVILNPADRV
jgi:hypothetical protein